LSTVPSTFPRPAEFTATGEAARWGVTRPRARRGGRCLSHVAHHARHQRGEPRPPGRPFFGLPMSLAMQGLYLCCTCGRRRSGEVYLGREPAPSSGEVRPPAARLPMKIRPLPRTCSLCRRGAVPTSTPRQPRGAPRSLATASPSHPGPAACTAASPAFPGRFPPLLPAVLSTAARELELQPPGVAAAWSGSTPARRADWTLDDAPICLQVNPGNEVPHLRSSASISRRA